MSGFRNYIEINGNRVYEAPDNELETIREMLKTIRNQDDFDFSLACLETLFRKYLINHDEWTQIRYINKDIWTIIVWWSLSGHGEESYCPIYPIEV